MGKEKYTKHTLITELHKYKDETGVWPIQKACKSSNSMPSQETYRRRFGSFSEAVSEARRTY